MENVLLLSISRISPQTLSLYNILSENFTLSNSIILVENLIRGKRAFEIFLIDHCASDIGNKSTAEMYLKNLASMSPTQY